MLECVAIHRNRVKFSPYVHRGINLIPGYTSISLPHIPENCIRHYWVDSYKQLFKKHYRYILKEGESRYNRHERFSWKQFFRESIGSLKYSLFHCNGIRGGFKAIFLSLFYSWYISMSLLSLRRYQITVEIGNYNSTLSH